MGVSSSRRVASSMALQPTYRSVGSQVIGPPRPSSGRLNRSTRARTPWLPWLGWHRPPRRPGRRCAPSRASSPGRGRWGYEIKWDGMRLLAEVGPDDHLRLRSSRGNVVTHRFPELARSPRASTPRPQPSTASWSPSTIEADRPSAASSTASISTIRPRWLPRRRRAGRLRRVRPAGPRRHVHHHSAAPSERRRALEAVLEPGPSWRLSQLHIGGGAASCWTPVREAELEGVVAKAPREHATRLGKRSPSWIKTKIRRRQEFVVGGWAPGLGSRHDHLGALLVGYYEDGALRFAGRVGSGLTQRDLAELPGAAGSRPSTPRRSSRRPTT